MLKIILNMVPACRMWHKQHPDIVKKLEAIADNARQDLGDDLTGAKGTGTRPIGRVKAEKKQ